MKPVFISFTISIILAFGGIVSADQSEKEGLAVGSAKEWLKLVDAGQYTDSWIEAAHYFKEAIQQNHWEQALQGVRKPLGKVNSRNLIGTNYTTSLPGAPDGEYVVIQFETAFENKKSAVETVTPMLDKDGQWRVSGYYIK